MPKVRNDAGRALTLRRWTILPNSRVVSPLGYIKDELPADIAYGPQAKRLADQKLIAIQGYVVKGQEPLLAAKPEPKEPEKAPAAPVAKPIVPTAPPSEDLTALVNIGTGRARKMKEEGVNTFKDVVDLGAGDLSSMLGIDTSMAEAIVEDAKGKLG